MAIALTIGIMCVFFGFIIYMIEDGPHTFLDDINALSYMIIGIIVLINCGIHFLIS